MSRCAQAIPASGKRQSRLLEFGGAPTQFLQIGVVAFQRFTFVRQADAGALQRGPGEFRQRFSRRAGREKKHIAAIHLDAAANHRRCQGRHIAARDGPLPSLPD